MYIYVYLLCTRRHGRYYTFQCHGGLKVTTDCVHACVLRMPAHPRTRSLDEVRVKIKAPLAFLFLEKIRSSCLGAPQVPASDYSRKPLQTF